MMTPLGICFLFVPVLELLTLVNLEQIDAQNSKDHVRVFYKDPWPVVQTTAPAAAVFLGDTCPNNLCQNGGTCLMLNGNPQCQCNPGFVGDQCQDRQLQLSCDSDRMTFQVLKSTLQEVNVSISLLHMSNPACKLQETSELYASVTLTHENHTLCGTKIQVNGSHLIYTNELSTNTVNQRAEVPSSIISRTSSIRIGFSCVYRYDRVVSLPFPLLTSAGLATFMVNEGEFNVTMALYPTAEYLEPYNRPPVIHLNQHLYVQLQIHGHSPQTYFTLKLEECWATPWADHGSMVRHLLIRDGIANDSTTDLIDSGNWSLSRFSLLMFHFIQYEEVYLHCRIWLCQYNATQCHQQPRLERTKRELSDPYRKVVSCGPVKLEGSVRTSMEEPESGLEALIFAGSFAAGIVLLILSTVAFAKALKKMTALRSRANPAHVELLL
ncbi:pancreatic secretory granule membrane major glycoprotein GP2-like [Engystomops pustulosus]|uniref:pancreatic secretory granule membrane major glycoprotein GP2-like n=1 Tax=Engystomops pustulosus TaxID=76066 RepID=UPI003AFA15D9